LRITKCRRLSASLQLERNVVNGRHHTLRHCHSCQRLIAFITCPGPLPPRTNSSNQMPLVYSGHCTPVCLSLVRYSESEALRRYRVPAVLDHVASYVRRGRCSHLLRVAFDCGCCDDRCRHNCSNNSRTRRTVNDCSSTTRYRSPHRSSATTRYRSRCD